ncbi:hypothetical protein HYU22_02290 [Candidatus Woesearchaeota archaeon]|nr:hypothetical protein [Candidatus Woesearchaeota archaeon]
MASKSDPSLNHKRIFLILVVLILLLSSLNLAKAKGWLIPSQKKLEIVDGTIQLRSMTLEQKIAQMIVVQGSAENMAAWKNLMPGGVHMFGRKSEHVFRNTSARDLKKENISVRWAFPLILRPW